MYRTGQGVPQGYQEALKWYRKAAKQGLPQAQSNLGVMYDLGQGVPQDYVRAHMWYSIAAATLSGDNAKTAIQYQGIVASRLT
jgi:TPR repeat protein